MRSEGKELLLSSKWHDSDRNQSDAVLRETTRAHDLQISLTWMDVNRLGT